VLAHTGPRLVKTAPKTGSSQFDSFHSLGTQRGRVYVLVVKISIGGWEKKKGGVKETERVRELPLWVFQTERSGREWYGESDPTVEYYQKTGTGNHALRAKEEGKTGEGVWAIFGTN